MKLPATRRLCWTGFGPKATKSSRTTCRTSVYVTELPLQATAFGLDRRTPAILMGRRVGPNPATTYTILMFADIGQGYKSNLPALFSLNRLPSLRYCGTI